MSNHKSCEKQGHRKSKVSWATVIVPGLVGPKPRQCSVGDGQRVNIPVLVLYCMAVRGMAVGADSWLYPSKRLVPVYRNEARVRVPLGTIPMDPS